MSVSDKHKLDKHKSEDRKNDSLYVSFLLFKTPNKH